MKKGKKIIALSGIILAMAVAGIACQKNTITEDDIDPIGSETEASMEFVEATDSEELKENEKETKNKETSKAETKKETEDKKKETKETEKKSDNNKKETVVKETSKKEKETETKPQKPSTSEKPAETKPTRPPETKPQEPEKPAETQHQHHWVEQTKQVKHEAEGHYETVVVKEAWDEPIYKVTNICSVCQTDLGSTDSAIIHSVETGHGYYVGDFQVGSKHHDAVTEQKWVQDKAAWTETIVVGYKCSSCGDTKK